MADTKSATTSPQGSDPKAANRARFELELEFVQALANPFYLHSLAQQNILEKPAFINYLKYLLYFKEKDYARFIHYPHALHHLELLQHPEFRAIMKRDESFREYLHQKQFDHWRTWPFHFKLMDQPSSSRIQSHSLDERPTRRPLSPEDEVLYSSLDDNVHIASIQEKKRLWWRNAVVNMLFIGSWFLFAIVLSVYNKWMFSEQYMNFRYPLFVTTLHMIVQFGLAALVIRIWPKSFQPTTKPTLEEYGKKALPTSMATSLDIGLSNLSLKSITLSFYTMCKSSSLIFVLLFAFIFKLEKFSWRLIGVIFLIFSGVILMVATETAFVLGGFLLVISASGLGGLRWALTQTLLKNKKMGFSNPVATIFWLSPAMAVTLCVLSLIIESWSSLFMSQFFETFWVALGTILFLIAPGILAFCMVLSEYYILQRAGVVPMSIAGIAKEVTTITVGAWFFGDQLTPLNITGVAITVCGIILFTYHKYRKSLDSTVPLDGHGNPITPEDGDSDTELARGGNGYPVELDETTHLTLDRLSGEEAVNEDPVGVNDSRDAQLLFSAEDEQEDSDNTSSANDRNNSVVAGGGAHPEAGPVTSQDGKAVWI
ncbi:hypothetical protein V5O48_002254 [Marasmius crinis-equi]|uniref:Mediator of RNA polymerase II transcription subunit 31 n=1 Tax=Marasmius crinis-equi TaxID=585013 RepID=A0ABR3FWC7_9AGAR